MTAKFNAETDEVHWSGQDDDTPPGYTTALGMDNLGTSYLWLFRGPEISQEMFAGSILLAGIVPTMYDSQGCYRGWASGDDVQHALAWMAARNEES